MGTLPKLSIVKGPQAKVIPRKLHHIFEEDLIKSNIALIYQEEDSRIERRTTYGELDAISNQFANFILKNVHENQITPNDDGDWIIAVCMSPSDKLVTILLSIWKSGAAYLPIDPSFPEQRVKHILNEARPCMVVHGDNVSFESFDNVLSVSYEVMVSLSSELSTEPIMKEKCFEQGNNNVAITLYTSGSTGVPKGVRLPHSVILNRLQWQWNQFPYSATEKISIFKTALTFVDSISELWGPLLNGLAILIVPKKITMNPERLVDLLEKFKIERLVLVPTLLRSILYYLKLNEDSNLLYNLKTWVCSGESLPVSLAKEFFNYFGEGSHVLCNFYGSTEIMGDVTYYVCENKRQLEMYEKVPIGIPLYNTVIYLLDSDYRPVKLGETGEMFVSGANLADGYVNGRDLDKFIENPLAIDPKYSRLYRTGDFAMILKNGDIQYEGRTDAQVKIRGHRVDLSEIEKHLLSLNEVDKGIVLCYHPGQLDQNILSFVTLHKQYQQYNGTQIENLLSNKLAAYMIPQVIVIDTVPLLVNGKVDRQTLLKLYENTNNNDDSAIELDFNFDGIPPHQMSVAKMLFETIGHVIGRSTRTTLSRFSNFYELGGNSLNSIITVVQLREKGISIGITEFLTCRNLGEILDIVCSDSKNRILQNDNSMEIKMTANPLSDADKDSAISIISQTFLEKADLEQWVKDEMTYEMYVELLESVWSHLIAHELSFTVRDESQRILGVAFNMDAAKEPEINVPPGGLVYVLDLLDELESPFKENFLPKGENKIIHSFIMGTSPELTGQDNVRVMSFMENENVKIAKLKNFQGILTSNTSELTQQLGSNVYGYETLLDYQVNQYVHPTGKRPFLRAPDSQRILVHWKDITNLK